MMQWVEQIITRLGYIGVALLTAAENLFPPLPSEVILPLAGFAAARGELSIAGTIAAGAAGSLLGTSAYYFAGYLVSERRLKEWTLSYGGWTGIDDRDLDRARRWFERYGHWAILICRCVPGLRTVISLPAGMNRMRLGPFLFYSSVGTLLWTALLTLGGAWLEIATGESKIISSLSPGLS
ncbi:MAG: DedA family protein [Bryobacterales bacterium]